MASLAAGALMSNPLVQQAGRNIVGKVADKATEGVGGAIGGIFGKKGKRIGKKIGRGLSKFRKSIFGFEAGGKVRKVPMVVQGYNAGGVIARPMVRPLPAPRPRRRTKK